MAKILEYPRVTTLNDSDVLLIDGPNGTRIILQKDAAEQMVGAIIRENEILHASEIDNTVQTIVYDASGVISKVEHRAITGNALIRKDEFVFTDSQITETRTAASGATLVMVTTLSNLSTTVTYTPAE